MALVRVIKHAANEKGEVYYEFILKLANYLQQKAYDSLLTIFPKLSYCLS
jgi:hypothetical protein